MEEERTTPPSPSSAPTPTSPYSPLHPLLHSPTSNPHVFVKPRNPTLTLTPSLSSSSLSSLPPASDSWELVAGAAPAPAPAPASAGDGGLDDCAIFPPSLHEGLHLETLDRHDEEVKHEEEEEDDSWVPFGLRRKVAEVARRLWEEGTEAATALRNDMAQRPAAWSVAAAAAAAAAVVGALVYARRRDRREKELLLLLVQEKDKRIAQLLHQIAFMNDIGSDRRAVPFISNS